MRVAVLGGTVFIGRAIVSDLVNAGHEVLVCHRGDHEPDGPPFDSLRHLHADRANLKDHRSELDEFAADAMVDCRALGRADSQIAVDCFEPGVKLVVLSSVDAYRAFTGLVRNELLEPAPITEDSAPRDEKYPYRGQMPGMDDYDKLDVEEVYCGRGGVALRLPMVSGPFDYQRREEYILRRVRGGRARIPVGDGMWLNSRSFVGDVARAVRLAVEAPADGVEGEMFNVCEARTYPILHVVKEILDAAGSDAELVRVPNHELPDDLGATGAVAQPLLVSSEKISRVLGFHETPREEVMKTTVEWHLENPPPEPEDGAPGFEADDEALTKAL